MNSETEYLDAQARHNGQRSQPKQPAKVKSPLRKWQIKASMDNLTRDMKHVIYLARIGQASPATLANMQDELNALKTYLNL